MDMNNFSRRDFIAGALAAGLLPVHAAKDCQIWFAPELHGEEALAMPVMKDFKPTQLEIHVGAAKPFSILHISDSHIAQMNTHDLAKADEVELKWYEGRRRHFATAATGLTAALVYARVNKLPIIHTGDLADYLSDANCRIIQRDFEGADCLYAVGNHEWGGTPRPSPCGKNLAAARARAEPYFPNRFPCHSRIINGINFVAFDNVGMSNDIFDEQFATIEKEFDKGLPVVLAYHIPYFTQDLAENMVSQPKMRGKKKVGDLTEAYLVACPGKYAARINIKLSKWLKTRQNLKAMLCGHLHREYQGPFTDKVTQYVAGATYMGNAYVIKFV